MSILLFINRNTIPGVFTMTVPPLVLEEPPVLISIDLPNVLEKGTPTKGSVIITNQSSDVQDLSLVLKRNGSCWIINGIIECSYSVGGSEIT